MHERHDRYARLAIDGAVQPFTPGVVTTEAINPFKGRESLTVYRASIDGVEAVERTVLPPVPMDIAALVAGLKGGR